MSDFLDLRTLPDGSTIETPICIIGGGAAGITLAMRLAELGIDCTLLESGGMEFATETQSLYQGRADPADYDLSVTRLRYFGGSTNHWEGWCRPLLPIELGPRPWLSSDGWPITRQDLAPFEPAAHSLLRIGDNDYDIDALLPESASSAAHAASSASITPCVFHKGDPVRFREAYAPVLAASPRIRTILHTNAVAPTCDRDGTPISLLVRSLTGVSATIRAERFILACGGIENTRLLLHWSSLGLPPLSPLLGAHFTDHPWLRAAAYIYPRSDWWRSFREHHNHREGRLALAMHLSEAEQRSAKLPGCSAFLIGADAGEPGVRPEDTPLKLLTVAEPHPEGPGRITLSADADPLGVPRIQLSWPRREQDQRTMLHCCRRIGETLTSAGLARVRAVEALDFQTYSGKMCIGSHHVGGARMGPDAARGVVDADCRVHGVPNLYVAGSAVFPTAGFANPTLTIVTLALRLAAHLAALPRPR